MKKFLLNILIRITGFIKRLARHLRIFFTHHKSILKYSSIAVALIASLLVIILLVSNIDFDFDLFQRPETTPIPSATETPVAISNPTATPVAHIYGDAPLVILDASEFNDSGYISQKANEFSTDNDFKGQYIKVKPNDFLLTYSKMKSEGNTPNLVIASNDLLMSLEGFENISTLHNGILFNNASIGAVKDDKIPIALKMYGYYFRVDLLTALSQEIPSDYNQLDDLSKRFRSDNAYDYLKYDEENELLSQRAEEFLTSRFGFGFPGGDIGVQLFIDQAIGEPFEDGTNILHLIKSLWDEYYLPPDSVYASDSSIEKSYMNDGLVGVFAPGTLYEMLYQNSERYYGTKVVTNLGNEDVYTANVIYCAVPKGTNVDVATSFLSLLYYGGSLDKIIAQNHTGYLPISNFLNDGSPWKAALNENSKMIYYESDYYNQVIKHIILASESVESALSKSQK